MTPNKSLDHTLPQNPFHRLPSPDGSPAPKCPDEPDAILKESLSKLTKYRQVICTKNNTLEKENCNRSHGTLPPPLPLNFSF